MKAGHSRASRIALKCVRYAKCYKDLAFGGRPKTLEGIIDYCVDRPVLMGQVRSEVLELGKVLEAAQPRRSLEIGTNYGGTLLLWCMVSAPDATIISVDMPAGPFGGGYPRRKIPLYHRFPRANQQLHLIRADSHSPSTKESVLRILDGEKLDYLFIDADHSYSGVKSDFEMYGPLVRSGGIVALHDIRTHDPRAKCEVEKFWNEIKREYRHREIIEQPSKDSLPIAVTGAMMETGGLGLLFMP